MITVLYVNLYKKNNIICFSFYKNKIFYNTINWTVTLKCIYGIQWNNQLVWMQLIIVPTKNYNFGYFLNNQGIKNLNDFYVLYNFKFIKSQTIL